MPSDSFCIFTSGSGILASPPQLELQLCCDLLDAKLCLDCLWMYQLKSSSPLASSAKFLDILVKFLFSCLLIAKPCGYVGKQQVLVWISIWSSPSSFSLSCLELARGTLFAFLRFWACHLSMARGVGWFQCNLEAMFHSIRFSVFPLPRFIYVKEHVISCGCFLFYL